MSEDLVEYNNFRAVRNGEGNTNTNIFATVPDCAAHFTSFVEYRLREPSSLLETSQLCPSSSWSTMSIKAATRGRA